MFIECEYISVSTLPSMTSLPPSTPQPLYQKKSKKKKKKKILYLYNFFPDYLLFTFVRVVIKYSCVKSIRRFGQIDVSGDVRQGVGERRTRRLLKVSDVGKERTEEEGPDSHSTHTLHRLTSHRLRKQLVLRHSNNSCHFISHVPFLKPDF